MFRLILNHHQGTKTVQEMASSTARICRSMTDRKA